jgi:CheY-like chemotaxis protein
MVKIVFCEDEKLLQKLFRVLLRSTEHEIYMASDGIEGLAVIKRVHPDLILTDISMPGLDGFQLADAVKADPSLAAIPIVFVTGFAQKYDMEEAARHGARGYLLKPFTTEDLRAVIAAALVAREDKSEGGDHESTYSTERH